MKEVIEIESIETGSDYINEDHILGLGYELIETIELYEDKGRYTENELVLKRISDGKYFRGGLHQDWGGNCLEFDSKEFIEVQRIEKQVTIVVYE